MKHKYDYFLACGDIYEARILENESIEFLVGYKSPHIPLEWMYFDNVLNGCLFFFLLDLDKQFKNEMFVKQ